MGRVHRVHSPQPTRAPRLRAQPCLGRAPPRLLPCPVAPRALACPTRRPLARLRAPRQGAAAACAPRAPACCRAPTCACRPRTCPRGHARLPALRAPCCLPCLPARAQCPLRVPAAPSAQLRPVTIQSPLYCDTIFALVALPAAIHSCYIATQSAIQAFSACNTNQSIAIHF